MQLTTAACNNVVGLAAAKEIVENSTTRIKTRGATATITNNYHN